MTSNSAASWASFRDPAGFIFQGDGRIKRAVSLQGKEDYDLLMESGLYDALTERGWLIPHTEAQSPTPDHCYKILTPENIPVWTYPYEWCFSQLKEAAIITLEIQLLALQHGLSLKDGTPFNVQFLNNRPIHIDTLSFE